MIASNDSVIHRFDNDSVQPDETSQELSYMQFILLLIVMIGFGIVVGFGANKLKGSKTSTTAQNGKVEKTAGIVDKKTFKDSAEGVLKEGGVDGEGNFHLERPGGESQNVYLTSTKVDLSKYLGKKVRVWGETFKAEKAGWLMDVGLVEVL